jgi:hypothetical protein
MTCKFIEVKTVISRGCHGLDHMVVKLSLQSVPITTKVASSNLGHDEVYLMQHYVIKFAPGTLVFSTNKTDRQNRTEIN